MGGAGEVGGGGEGASPERWEGNLQVSTEADLHAFTADAGADTATERQQKKALTQRLEAGLW